MYPCNLGGQSGQAPLRKTFPHFSVYFKLKLTMEVLQVYEKKPCSEIPEKLRFLFHKLVNCSVFIPYFKYDISSYLGFDIQRCILLAEGLGVARKNV